MPGLVRHEHTLGGTSLDESRCCEEKQVLRGWIPEPSSLVETLYSQTARACPHAGWSSEMQHHLLPEQQAGCIDSLASHWLILMAVIIGGVR